MSDAYSSLMTESAFGLARIVAELRAQATEQAAENAELRAQVAELEALATTQSDNLQKYAAYEATWNRKQSELRREVERLTVAGFDAAAGETIKVDEANTYYAEAERLRAENKLLRQWIGGELMLFQSEIDDRLAEMAEEVTDELECI